MRADRLLRRGAIGALVLSGLGLSVAGSAYTLIGWDWSYESSPMQEPFFLNPSSFDSRVGTTNAVRDALEDGYTRWGLEGGADFDFNQGGDTTSFSTSADSFHVAQWSSSYASGGTLAVAQSFGFGDNMTDCDIVFFAGNGGGQIDWSSNPAGAGRRQIDLYQTAIHEFGHCAGLGHSASSGAVMYAFASSGTGPSARVLDADDRAGLQAMYGTAPTPGPTGLALSLENPIIAGGVMTLEVTGADPFETINIGFSPNGEGSGPCFSGLGGECLDIRSPASLLVTSQANGSGTLRVSLNVPATASGTPAFQAVVVRGPGGADTELSNPVSYPILPAGSSCPADETFDCQGDCYPDDYPGDGYCDDGTTYSWGSPDFMCTIYDFDEGDCGP